MLEYDVETVKRERNIETMLRSGKECWENSKLSPDLESSSEESEDSEPEVDEPDEAERPERYRRDLRSTAFPSTSGLVFSFTGFRRGRRIIIHFFVF